MGADSYPNNRRKIRTGLHKKHTPYPGMRTPDSKTAYIEKGSIRAVIPPKEMREPITKYNQNDPLWMRADETFKKLNDTNLHAVATLLGLRTSAEINYALAYRALVRAGKSMRLKKKYRFYISAQ